MNWMAGLVTDRAVRMSVRASRVLGFLNRSSAASNAPFRRLLSFTVRGSTGMPVLNAALILGRERGRAGPAGRRRRERSVKSARNGRWTRREWIEVSRVGGDFSIVAWRAL